MGPRKLDVAMTDQDYEALKKKLLETYSVRSIIENPTVKSLVDWHCLEGSCFFGSVVFGRREKWMRHHKRLHNQMCENDRDYPREIEAKQFIQEHELRENARHGIAGAGGSAGLRPPTATPTGPYSRISGALLAIPLNSGAPSSSTSEALCGASPNSAAPNSPRSAGALRKSAAASRRGPRGSYRVRANNATRRQEHPDQGNVNIAGALQDEPKSSGTLDPAEREILMQQLSYNLHALSQINTDSVHIMQILGLPSTNCVSETRLPAGSKRPRDSPNIGAQGYPTTTVATPVPLPTWVSRRALDGTSQRARGLQAGQSKFVDAASKANQAPAHANEGSAHVFGAPPYPSQAPAHSNEGPAHPNQVIALSIGGKAHSYQGPPLSAERPSHPYESPPLSTGVSLDLALAYRTPGQPEEEEEEENYNVASDSEKVDNDSEDQATEVSHAAYEGQVEWMDVKIETVEANAAGSWL